MKEAVLLRMCTAMIPTRVVITVMCCDMGGELSIRIDRCFPQKAVDLVPASESRPSCVTAYLREVVYERLMVMETMTLIRKKLLGRREKLIHAPTIPPQTNNISTKDSTQGLAFFGLSR